MVSASRDELQRLHAEHGILTQAWRPIGGITSYVQAADSRSVTIRGGAS
jgi:hypothetical protein